MNLEEHTLCRKWLEQFNDADRDAASMLLRRLRCISPNTFLSELKALFFDAATKLTGLTAVYAARELNNQSYFLNKTKRPIAVQGNQPVGSEGVIANLITNITRENPEIFLNHSPIVTLKKKRCRNIAICDDCCGSGKRLSDFIEEFLRVKTIRSWLSGGLIRFHVFAYAISEKAKERIYKTFSAKRTHDYVKFHYCQNFMSGAQLWSEKEILLLDNLCKEYGQQHKIRSYYWKGFGNQLCNLVFSHSCPNNVPGILWEKTKTWIPLFPNRAIPQELQIFFTDNPSDYQQSVVFKSLDASTILKNKLYAMGSQSEKDILTVLSAVRSGCRKIEFIAVRTGLSNRRVQFAVDESVRFNLIDKNLRLCHSGLDALKIAEHEATLKFHNLGKIDNYYPTSLRPHK